MPDLKLPVTVAPAGPGPGPGRTRGRYPRRGFERRTPFLPDPGSGRRGSGNHQPPGSSRSWQSSGRLHSAGPGLDFGIENYAGRAVTTPGLNHQARERDPVTCCQLQASPLLYSVVIGFLPTEDFRQASNDSGISGSRMMLVCCTLIPCRIRNRI